MPVSDDIRKLIIESYLNGECIKHISAMFGIKYYTVNAIITVYKKEDRYKKKKKGGIRNKKLGNEQINAIKLWIDEDCGLSLKSIQKRIFDQYEITVCLKTVDNYISSFCYTLKNVSMIPLRRNDDKSIQARYDYAFKFIDILSHVNDSHIYFVDEVGFNVSMRCKKGRSKVGTPAIQVVPGLRSRNISVCCAMTKEGIAKFVCQTTAFKTETFADFIDNLLIDIRDINIEKAVIILDNVAFHKHSTIKAKFDKTNHVMLFLPPYSPFLNPIENVCEMEITYQATKAR